MIAELLAISVLLGVASPCTEKTVSSDGTQSVDETYKPKEEEPNGEAAPSDEPKGAITRVPGPYDSGEELDHNDVSLSSKLQFFRHYSAKLANEESDFINL